jgi:predicted lipoprotein with Yx(FWY)xxD motif
MMKLKRGSILMFLSVPLIAIGLAACGGSSNSSSGSSNASAAATPVSQTAGADTVSTKSVSGVGTVLVDSQGHALYTNNQDTSSKMACTSACQAFWPPLKASGQPTSSDSAIQAKLGVANGQVTFGGKPLYTFVQDTSPGQVTGNGFMDSFGGTSFTWTVAMAGGGASSGSAPAASPSSSSSSASPSSSSTGSSGGSSGGYGY